MSSDTKTNTTADTQNNSTNNKNDTTSPPAPEDNSFYAILKKYIKSFYDTNFLIIVLFVIMFLYYVHNNIYFLHIDSYVGKPAGYIRYAGGILLALFYGFFITVIVKSSKDMLKTYTYNPDNPDNSSYFSSTNIIYFIVSLLVTFVVLGFCLFIVPYYLTNAGFVPKGLMRVWNPFNSTAGVSNIKSIPIETIKGYDTDGLYWGGDSFNSKLLFYFLSLPMVVIHFFFGSSFFNFWIIPALSGDGSNTGTKWSSDNKPGPALPAGVGWFFWIIGLSLALPLKIANFFSSFISENMVYKYLNPVDWPILSVISNPVINSFYNTTYFDTNFKGYSTKYYAFWTNAFVAVAILKVIFTSLMFPSGTTDIFHTNIQLLVITAIIGYVVIQFFKKQQNVTENYLNIFNFKSTGVEQTSLKQFQDTMTNVSNTEIPGILYPRDVTGGISNIELTNMSQPQPPQIPQSSNIEISPISNSLNKPLNKPSNKLLNK